MSLSSIQGVQPPLDEVEFVYNFYPQFKSEINYNKFSFTNPPVINVFELIKEGKKFNNAVNQLKRYVMCAKNTNHTMNNQFVYCLEIERVYAIVEPSKTIDLVIGETIIPDEVKESPISHKTLYLMKDGNLMIGYSVGVSYFQKEPIIKQIIETVKGSFTHSKKDLKSIINSFNKAQDDWNEVYLKYPDYAV